MTRRPLSGLPTAPRSDRELWRACCHGREPAEALDPRDREDLIAGLHGRGWTDQEIAAHTRLTCYTVARIRQRIGLLPNPPAALAA